MPTTPARPAARPRKPAVRAADPDVTAVYTAEDRLARWLELGTVTVFGSRWALEPEVVFARVGDVAGYVARVLEHLAANGWSEHGARPGAALTPVAVRERRGALKAHYDQQKRTIAIPPVERGGGWALRESVVLHELAHHLVAHGVVAGRATNSGRSTNATGPSEQPHPSGRGEPAHGPAFRGTLLALLAEAGHPTASALLGIAFADEGLASGTEGSSL